MVSKQGPGELPKGAAETGESSGTPRKAQVQGRGCSTSCLHLCLGAKGNGGTDWPMSYLGQGLARGALLSPRNKSFDLEGDG